MFSISEFSKKANLSARALRLYEEKGLIAPSYRGANGYRFYFENLLPKVEKIQKLKALGFTLEEIKKVLKLDQDKFQSDLQQKLKELRAEIGKLKNREEEILKLLSVTEKIEQGRQVNSDERRVFMDGIKQDIIKNLNQRFGTVSERQLEFLERDKSLYNTNERAEFIEAVKSCVQFARDKNLIMGPSRGSAPASIVLYGLGFSQVDPTKYGLIPERLLRDAPDLHIDVEFERGQDFVDYCREVSKNLSYGQINAFKMPLLNIIDNVHKKIGKVIDYNGIDDDDDLVLSDIQRGDIEKIFCLDMSPDALIMKYENIFPEYLGFEKMAHYFQSQKIHSFLDVLNIVSVWRPNDAGKIERIEAYKKAKEEGFRYDFLSPSLQEFLRPNFGRIIYHEDIIRILKEYTDWDYDKCSVFRRDAFKGEIHAQDLQDFQAQAPREIVELVLNEAPYTFCKSHIVAFSQLIKQTAVLKSLHKDTYFNEIEKWEQKFGYKWDDIGIRMKGVSLLQH